MSAPAQPYGSWVSPRSPLRGGAGVVSFGLGLLVAFAMLVYAAWLAVTAVHSSDNSAGHVSGTGTGVVPYHADAVTPSPAALPAPTPHGTTLPFDHLWVSGDGNTIVAGAPIVGVSALTGESMIQVPVTLTNNGEQSWSPEATNFLGTLNQAPAAESTEGDWMYRAPIAPHTSVTLNKIFIGHPGHFTLRISTPHDTALFAGGV